jgi:hypothetical protein
VARRTTPPWPALVDQAEEFPTALAVFGATLNGVQLHGNQGGGQGDGDLELETDIRHRDLHRGRRLERPAVGEHEEAGTIRLDVGGSAGGDALGLDELDLGRADVEPDYGPSVSLVATLA